MKFQMALIKHHYSFKMPCIICRKCGHNRRTCPLVRTIQPLDKVFEEISHINEHHNHEDENFAEEIQSNKDTKDHIIQSSVPEKYKIMEFPIIQLNGGGYRNINLDVYEVASLIKERNSPICCMVETPSIDKAYKILRELKRETERDYTMICEKVGNEYISIFIDKEIFDIDEERYEVNNEGKYIDIGLIKKDTGEHLRILETHLPRGKKDKEIKMIKEKLNDDDYIFTGNFNCNPDKLKKELIPHIVNLAIKDDENPIKERGIYAMENIGSLKKDCGRIFNFNESEVDKTLINSTDHYPLIANVCSFVR